MHDRGLHLAYITWIKASYNPPANVTQPLPAKLTLQLDNLVGHLSYSGFNHSHTASSVNMIDDFNHSSR